MQLAIKTEQADDPVAIASLEFLAFHLGGEVYGIDIQKVQELCGYDTVTRIANAPAFIKGVVNLRGVIVPIARRGAGKAIGGCVCGSR